MKTGVATIPLDYGKCPPWLFARMRLLSRGIITAIAEEFSPEEILRRFSDPIWFQSFGCVLAFDWNSSGLTTTTLGAVKAAMFDVQDSIGIYICGGKGKTSKKTPEEIVAYGISRGFSFAPELVYASKMAAKIDSSLIQDGYQLYHHNFMFTKSGEWAVVQQGLNTENKSARRYHWLSTGANTIEKSEFVIEPHSGIASQVKSNPLNLTAKDSDGNREISKDIVNNEPKKFLRNLELIQAKKSRNLTLMELFDKEFYWHPVIEEKFDLKRLSKTVSAISDQQPKDYESLVSLKGVGPRTIRALSLVAEIIYGAKPSYEDPARYTFSFGGKDGTPYPVDRDSYDKTLALFNRGILKSGISLREKADAQKRLKSLL